ncbi:hypothetical protein [Changpingibacter yushuensis]|uniref:hypothetical protein n=1 Tax=Changpingibacter yushuensis TaxID=2758440 RepID=UPI0015F63D35|nr:hypothetical protein [Changpingibacter yushuensis]
MQRIAYAAMAKVFAVVLVIVGAAAIFGGSFAHSFITDQLSQEEISMPTEDGISSLSEESQKVLTPFIGQELTTGIQAKAFADNYIYEHMQNIADGRTYEAVSGEYTKMANDPDADQDELATLAAQRQQLFMGSTLRGTLLNAYGWWLVGSIAFYVGVGAIVAGVVLGGLGWGVLRPKKDATEAAATAPATE